MSSPLHAAVQGRHASDAPTVRAIALDAPEEWRAALAGIPHSFFHTWEHSQAMFLSTEQPAYLFCVESDGVRVVCPFVERRIGNDVDIATPYGFSGFAGNGILPGLDEIWRRFAVARGYVCAFLSLHPLFAVSGCGAAEELAEIKPIYALDTTQEMDALWHKCSESRRRALRHWRQSEVSLVTDREELARFFLEQYPAFFRRKGASPVYNFSPATMEFLLGQPNVLTLGAARGGRLEAVLMLAHTPYGAEYLFNIGLPEGQQDGAGLVWEAARLVHGMKLPHLNLGGGIAADDSLAEFKRRFGGGHYPLRVLRQVLLLDRYQQLCVHAGMDPQARGYFPPYRAPESKDGGND